MEKCKLAKCFFGTTCLTLERLVSHWNDLSHKGNRSLSLTARGERRHPRRRILATRNAPDRQRFSAGFCLRHPTLPRPGVFVKHVVCRARATTRSSSLHPCPRGTDRLRQLAKNRKQYKYRICIFTDLCIY